MVSRPVSILEVVGFDVLDELAVVVPVQLGRDRVLQVEALSKTSEEVIYRGGRRASLVTRSSSLRESRQGSSSRSMAPSSGRISRTREPTSASSISMKN